MRRLARFFYLEFLRVYDGILMAMARLAARRFHAPHLADRIADGAFARSRSGGRPPPAHVTVGRYTYGAVRSAFFYPTAASSVTIGNFCSIGPEVRIICHANHPTNLPSTYPFRSLMTRRFLAAPAGGPNHDASTKGPIVIGHDVWIGEGAIILSGCRIGTGSVIGAGAVVAGTIPPYSVAVGNPARVVKTRHPSFVNDLLASRWWDLPDAEIAALDQAFYSPDIPAFLAAVAQAWKRVPASPQPALPANAATARPSS